MTEAGVAMSWTGGPGVTVSVWAVEVTARLKPLVLAVNVRVGLPACSSPKQTEVVLDPAAIAALVSVVVEHADDEYEENSEVGALVDTGLSDMVAESPDGTGEGLWNWSSMAMSIGPMFGVAEAVAVMGVVVSPTWYGAPAVTVTCWLMLDTPAAGAAADALSVGVPAVSSE